MSEERQKTPVQLALPPAGGSEASASQAEGTEALRVGRNAESPAYKNQHPMEEICERENLRQALRQVRANQGSTPGVLTELDKWVRRRVRHAFWRQWQTGRNRCAELWRRGANLSSARKAAGSRRGPWRMSQTETVAFALSNAYLASLGLPSLAAGR
jgi:hypothetical protein